MGTQYEFGKHLRNTRIINLFLIVSIIMYADILYQMFPKLDTPTVFSIDNSTLTVFEVIAGFMVVYSLFFSIFRNRHYVKMFIKKYNDKAKAVSRSNILCYSLFEAIAIYGLILGVLGAEWQITLPFFLVSGVFLIIYFPTTKKWENTLKAAIE